MGKRSNFARVERDFYRTPFDAVLPLLPHLRPRTRYAEPCAGDGRLIIHLGHLGHDCAYASDIFPSAPGIDVQDARTLSYGGTAQCFITNPPWDRKVLHPIIENLSSQRPTWLLFDADWSHTLQARPYLTRLRKIVSVGRVKWIDGSKHTGKDNCAWHLFGKPELHPPAAFYGRVPRAEIIELLEAA